MPFWRVALSGPAQMGTDPHLLQKGSSNLKKTQERQLKRLENALGT